ncbi:hypothetical protein SAMN05216232_0365 [Virgibacillus subterraneus]|uniref:Uncharacterized protein n=1 Tax=Virgibacillus subterraneus TaxID=621109 RepID=A0A1H8ZBB5_9BACI|nr:hypothetical protein [Virgibacillus subterraneus]SEP61715.1 hypothetical protein SAMN05216232_0365 [Virgibacillus subterraneus]
MYNTVLKSKKHRVLPHGRVATKEQLVSNKSTTQKKKVNPTITVGDKSYLMPKELMKPIYEYKSRFNIHMDLKETIMHLK